LTSSYRTLWIQFIAAVTRRTAQSGASAGWVGAAVTRRPPHRPLRADFPHKVPRYPVRFHYLLAVRITRKLTRPTGAPLNYPSPVVGFALRQLVGSASFLSFHPTRAMPGLSLPSGGSLGSHFPTFPGTMLGYDCHLPFSMVYAPARPPIPCLLSKFVSSLKARQEFWSVPPDAWPFGHPVRLFRGSDKETNGSPKFPGYLFKFMPRSSTPVVS
jgi:hypothetical protein